MQMRPDSKSGVAMRLAGALGAVATALWLSAGPMAGAVPKFYADDPLTREPETQDASAVAAWDIDLVVDLLVNLFGQPGDRTQNVRARNLNTIDEVPDSSWFTNRILARPVSIEEAVQGPLSGTGPAPGTWTVARAKEAGAAPGFTMRDSRNDVWFVSFDARGHPEAATGAILVANKIFWTLGYWQVENVLVTVHADTLAIGETATMQPQLGARRKMLRKDLDELLQRAHRSPDGTYRAVTARAVPGRPLGGFRYYGTRPDDPNDIVDHEHRRELRGLKVFGAWTNLVDMKAGNTLDALVTEHGKGIVRHYLQDVGSTFGTGANGPREYDEGWEYLYEGQLALKRLLRFGFVFQPWQTTRYVEHPAIGRFEGARFAPEAWKPRVPTAALRHTRPDDSFWAARRVMAFSDDLIRALARTGSYSDPQAERLLANVLIERRNAIGRVYLTAVNPLVGFALGADGRLTFDNAAVQAGVAQAPGDGYSVSWSRFDNATGGTTALGQAVVRPGEPAGLSAIAELGPRAYLKVQVAAVKPAAASWAVPVDVYFRRTAAGWTLVGLDRLP